MGAVLEVDNLNVSMHNGAGMLVPVIENLSFSVRPGQTMALVGRVRLRQEHDRACDHAVAA